MLYRALSRLDKGHKKIDRGQVFGAGEFDPKAIKVLEERRRIAPVAAPPIAEMPGWRSRAKKLGAIEMVDQFIEADAAALAAALGVNPEQIGVWKAELGECLVAPKDENC